MHAQSCDPAPYTVTADDEIIRQALEIIERRLTKPGEVFSNPSGVKDYLRLQLARREDQHREVFTVLFLDSQNRLIATEDMFTGTLTQTSVYPREVVRRALHHHAAAVVLAHNHPSGVAEPSRADEALTQTLKSALALMDVRVLDHFIVTLSSCRSMAEMGLV
jgi:DNA repair protein RadC